MSRFSTAMFLAVTGLFAAMSAGVALAQSVDTVYEGRLKEASLLAESSPTNAAAVTVGIEVSKTAFVDGQNVCGVIRIKNVGQSPVSVTGVVDFLEVHFPRNLIPPPLPPSGLTRDWFKVADVPIPMPGVPLPGPIAPRATATIDYCFSLCLAADAPGANSMRNVVTVTVTSQSGIVKTVTTRSVSFPPPVLDCQACCLGDGSCTDTVPGNCATAGGLSKGTGTDCATTECTQACCLGDGTCRNETLSACQKDGEALGLGTTCETVTTTCRGACCLSLGCVDELGEDECEDFSPGPGTYLGNGTTCESDFALCPSGACCLDGVCSETYPLGTHEIHIDESGCQGAFVGGHYLGDGTTCASTSCTEACCFNDAPCQDLLPSACEQQGGDPQGPGIDCGILGISPCSVIDPGP